MTMRVKRDLEHTLNLWEKEVKKGFTAYMILLLLHDKPMYGYEIKQQLEDASEGKLQFKENAIYQNLKQIKNKGFVEAFWDKSPRGPRRHYYKATDKGKQLLATFSQSCIMPMFNMLHTVQRSIDARVEADNEKETTS